MVTICGVSQLEVVNVNWALSKVASSVFELETGNVTSAVGTTFNTTDTEAVLPSSEVLASEVVTVIPCGTCE